MLPGGYRTLSLERADRACAHLAALHAASNKRVDVEVLLAMDDSIEAVHLRFLADARKAATLESPNVDRVLHVGVTSDGHPFVVRERASGQALAALLAKMGSLPTEHAVDVAIAICRALESAHAVGLVHAELDPTMVRLDLSDAGASNVKVAGLGTSRALAMLPTEGRSFMSLALRAPELLSGDAVDARVDMWGIGVLLYTMLAGEMPFAADSPSKMDVSSTGDEPALLAGVPDGLGEIVDACLARDPAVRPPSAASLAARLSLFGSHPVFGKRSAELVVDTGPYDAVELERALREAQRADSERDVVRERDKTPVPTTVSASVAASSPPPPVAITVAPPVSLRSTLAVPDRSPRRHWRTAGLVAVAAIAAGVVAVAGSLQSVDAPSPRAASNTVVVTPVAVPSPVTPIAPNVEPTPIAAIPAAQVVPSSSASTASAASTLAAMPARALPAAPSSASPSTRVRPRSATAAAPASGDPLVRSAAAPIQPQPKASDDDLRRFLDDRR